MYADELTDVVLLDRDTGLLNIGVNVTTIGDIGFHSIEFALQDEFDNQSEWLILILEIVENEAISGGNVTNSNQTEVSSSNSTDTESEIIVLGVEIPEGAKKLS